MRSNRWIFYAAFLIFFQQSTFSFSQQSEDILRRADKHFLGGGKMVVWAPQYPLFLDKPGFWDYSCFLDYKVEPNFTVTFLDENLKEIQLSSAEKSWLPSHLTIYYSPQNQLEIQEKKALLPDDVLVSKFSIKNNSQKRKKIHIILWTCQNIQENANSEFPRESKNSNFIYSLYNARSRVSWERQYNDSTGSLTMKIGLALGADQYAKSTAINVSQATWNYPHWQLTPFYEKMQKSGLPEEENFDWRSNPEHYKGLIYIGMYYSLEISPNENREFSAYCAIGPSEQKAIESFDRIPRQENPIQTSINNWESFYSNVPTFKCSDPYLEKYYYYRWYGLRLNMINTEGEFDLSNQAIFKGINRGLSRRLNSRSSQNHMLETRWMHQPELATGSFLNFVENQKPNGSFPGELKIGINKKLVGFYHANWGRAVREVYRVHPNHEFLYRAYQALKKYAEYFDHEKDKENISLYDAMTPAENGIDFENRIEAVDIWTKKNGNKKFKGIVATVYIYELKKNLAWMAEQLGKPDEAKIWLDNSRRIGKAILTRMWDDSVKFFFDIDPETGEKLTNKTIAGFYPFITDLVSENHLSALTEHLFNPNEFWTDYPVPSISLDDPSASVFGEWKNKRMNRPANGRSWALSTSHVCDGLAKTAQRFDSGLKLKAVELINRFVRMMYLDGDINRPGSYEYYNPFNGKPPYFSGDDNCANSWINDLIIKYVVGLQPGDENKIIINPLPFDLDSFTLDNVFIKGHLLKIIWRKNDSAAIDKGLYIFVDGKLLKHKKELHRYEFYLK